MAGDWHDAPLGDIANITTGKLDSNAAVERGRYAFFTCSPETLRIDDYVFEDEAVLLAGNNASGVFAVKYYKGKFNAYQRTYVITPKDRSKLDTKYLYYQLTRLVDLLREYSIGTATKFLTLKILSPLTIPLPSLNVQRSIAHILGTLDDKIELNRRMSETLEAIARALFKSWFVDFNPVRAKMGGRDAGLPKPPADLFPARLVDSELGEIPEGWEAATLESLASIQGGKQLPTAECNPHGTFPVYGANGIMGFAERATHNGFVIAFGRVGAYCGSVHWTYGGAWINNNASSVVPTHWPEYVLQVMLTADFEQMRTGSAQPFIPNSSLASTLLIRPSEELLDRFCSIVAPLRLREQATAAESRALGALRDTLLPKLISGELRVRNAERFSERVGA